MSLLANDHGQHSLASLVNELTVDVRDRHLSPQQRASYLEQVKILGRSADSSAPIFTRQGIDMLCMQGFTLNRNEPDSELEALRCLANCLLLAPATRAMLVELGFARNVPEQFQDISSDKEFLLSRIMLLLTYEASFPLAQLVSEYNLDARIEKTIRRHASLYSTTEKGKQSAIDQMALVEILKLIGNICIHINKEGLLASSLPHIVKLLHEHTLPEFPLQSPTIFLISALQSMDMAAASDVLFPQNEPGKLIRRLTIILDKALSHISTTTDTRRLNTFDEECAPLIALLLKLVDLAPEVVVQEMKEALLPSESERDKPLGVGTTLSARLLQLSNSASTPKTRPLVGHLLFKLSASNPEEFIHNVGYGYASGFLVNQNTPVSPQALTESSSSAGKKPVNPITGQTLESEPKIPDPFAGMTDEEKEREAERLFVLFERLKKTGVVDVKNPVEQALHEGRFEELDDDGKPIHR